MGASRFGAGSTSAAGGGVRGAGAGVGTAGASAIASPPAAVAPEDGGAGAAPSASCIEPLQRGQRAGGRSLTGSVATRVLHCRQLTNIALFKHAVGWRRRVGAHQRRMPSMRTQSPSFDTASASNQAA